MAQEAQRANNAKATQKPLVQVEAESKLAQLLALQDSGVPELDTSIETLRSQVAALANPGGAGLGWIG